MRYRLFSKDDPTLAGVSDPNGFLDYSWEDWSTVLVDTERNEIVFDDRCEPEDATLNRHFGALVDLLNEQASADPSPGEIDAAARAIYRDTGGFVAPGETWPGRWGWTEMPERQRDILRARAVKALKAARSHGGDAA